MAELKQQIEILVRIVDHVVRPRVLQNMILHA